MIDFVKRNSRRVAAIAGTSTALLVLGGGAAFADTPDPTVPVDAAATTLQTALISIATTILPLAAGLLALVLGWKWVRKFIH